MKPLLEFDPHRFATDFDRRPFSVAHGLATHPAFDLERLVALAARLPQAMVEYNAGDLPLTQDPTLTPRNGLSIDETLRRIAECRSWMVLKRVEQDPEYQQLLDECLAPVARRVPQMRRRQAFIFISSPGSVTPYHIDHEYNFLLQIRGRKSISLFDRAVLSEMEIERFYRGEHRNLVLSDAVRGQAQAFELQPGQGVHVPVNAPHYVVNGDAVSVSFSITFRTPEGDRRAAVYEVNNQLRQVGLSPRPVGQAPLRDRAKHVGYAVYQRAKQRFTRG